MIPAHQLLESVVELCAFVQTTPGLNIPILGMAPPSRLDCLILASLAERVASDARATAGDHTPAPAHVPFNTPLPGFRARHSILTRNRTRRRKGR
jgi:hypothetical protein